MEPLRDALRAISHQTGVSLRCQDAIAQEKVAIFVENRPAHEVLTQIARLFCYEWRVHEEGGYMLSLPDATRRADERLARAEAAAQRQLLRTLVEHARELVRLDQDALNKEYRQLSAEAEQRIAPMPPDQQLRLRVVEGLRGRLEECPDGTAQYEYASLQPLIHCLATLDAHAIDALVRGQTLGFSTRPAPGVRSLPAGAKLPSPLREQRLARHEADGDPIAFLCWEPGNPAFSGLWLRLSPVSPALEYRLVCYKRILELLTGQYAPLAQDERETRIFELPLPDLEDEAAFRQWRAWSTPAEQWARQIPPQRRRLDSVQPELRLPLYRFTTQVAPIAGATSHATAADALEWLAFSLRKPVVADAFRTVHFRSAAVRLYQDAPLETLATLAQQLWLRFDESGYLMARTRGYWRLRRYELPEAWLRPLEQKYRQQGRLDWSDYIELAGKFNDLQARRYTRMGWASYPEPAVEFEWEPMEVGLPAWRFLASLPPAMRQRALAEPAWFPAEPLTPLQRQRFLQAIWDDFPPDTALFANPPETGRAVREYAVPDTEPRDESIELVSSPAFRVRFWTKRSVSLIGSSGFRSFWTEVDQLPTNLAEWLQNAPYFTEYLQQSPGTVYTLVMECIGITITDGARTVVYRLGQPHYAPLR